MMAGAALEGAGGDGISLRADGGFVYRRCCVAGFLGYSGLWFQARRDGVPFDLSFDQGSRRPAECKTPRVLL